MAILASMDKRSAAISVMASVMEMNTLSLEDWAPGQPDEMWRAVKIVDRYLWDGRTRLRVEILEGPESGRVVSAIGEGSLRTRVKGVR